MLSARDPTDPDIQLCQVGLDSTANYTDLINSYGSIFVSQYVAKKSSSTSRRKRATYTYTCEDLTNMGIGIKSLSTSDLSTLSLADFYSCQYLLGASSNSWSSSQVQTLASIAKLVNFFSWI